MAKGMYSIKNRMLLSFLAVALLPIITLSIFSLIMYSRVIEKNVNQHTNQMISQIEYNIEEYLKSVDNIIYYISELQETKQFINEDTLIDREKVEIEIRRNLYMYVKENPEILAILIVNENDNYISNELAKNNRDLLTDEKWYRNARANPKQAHYTSNPIGRNITPFLSHSTENILSVSKAITDEETGKVLAVVLIDINLEKFEKIIKNNNIGEKGFFYILDQYDNLIYSPVNNIVYRINRKIFADDQKSLTININNEDFKLMYNISNKTGWKTIGVFSIKDILSEVTNIQKITIVIAIITFIFTLLTGIVFAVSIVTPVKELNGLMKQAEMGDLDVIFDDKKYKDEFGELGHSFNHMIKEIKKLINMVYKEQRSKRKAELKILQAQIKPHFLYNTLDTISWMADDYGAEDIVNMVNALTKVFRIGLNKGREIISVSEELEHVSSYMVIQKTRYEDKLDYEIIYDKELLEFKILKLTTQPIVENAIYHGVKQKSGKGMIIIEFKRGNDDILIQVKDNGIGINGDKLDEINEMLESDTISSVSSETGSGYGIYNVNSRIKLTYGSQYGLKFRSELNKGTVVEIRIPISNKS